VLGFDQRESRRGFERPSAGTNSTIHHAHATGFQAKAYVHIKPRSLA
jgi:hypothetical protein